MPEDIPVFLVDIGRADVLFPATDFYGVVAGADYELRSGPGPGDGSLVAKGARHECSFLEPSLRELFGADTAGAGAEPLAFLARGRGPEPLAFVLERAFEMRSYPMAEFRLLPRGLRRLRASAGLIALRFEGGCRMQYVLDLCVIKNKNEKGAAP